jgi:HAD superfamily hydrolase (TIGR01490 family)
MTDSPYLPSGPIAAFFDLDRTLISGSSAFVLGVAAWRAGLVPPRQFRKDAVSAVAFRFSGASDNTSNGVRDRILGAVKGVRVDDLVALNADIVPKLLAKVRPEAQALVDRHRHAGRATYIVSASPVELVEPLAKALGMTAGIGTVSEIVDGVYTGELAGPFCYGPGKVEAITELANWENFDLAQCYAYSDSASDLPMLEAVGHPIAVNPDAKLERVAHHNGWPIVVFSKRTKSVVRRTTQALGTVGVGAAGFAAGARYARAHLSGWRR